MKCSGSFVALVTPFDRKGRLDHKTLAKLVEWHIKEGTDGIVCSATTGEGATLSDLERKKVAEICIKTSAKRIPIIVATGINDTKTSVRHTETAKKLGANACLVVTPYYVKPTQKGCLLHFKEVAKVGLPVVIYNNPARTVVKLNAETIAEASHIPGIIAIKESSHDIEHIRAVRKLCPIPIFSGDDDFTLEIIREGGVGCIGVTPNLIPRGWKKMIQYALSGKWDKAHHLFNRYAALGKSLFLETNPQGVKFAMSWLKRCHPILRLPMILPADTTQLAIKKTLLQLALPQYEKWEKSATDF